LFFFDSRCRSRRQADQKKIQTGRTQTHADNTKTQMSKSKKIETAADTQHQHNLDIK